MSGWFSFAKKYLWHEEKTPFHLSPKDMSRLQAHNEILLFSIFEGVIASMIILGSYLHVFKTGDSSFYPILIYSFSLLIAIFILNKHKNLLAACFCLTPPLIVFGILTVFGFHPNNGIFEKTIISVFIIFWFFYTIRIFEICRNFNDLKSESVSSSSNPIHQ